MTKVKIENVRVQDIDNQQSINKNNNNSNDSSIDMNTRWGSLHDLFQTTLRQLAEASDKDKFIRYTSALGFSNIESQLIYDALRMKYFKKHQKFQQKQMSKQKPKVTRSLTSSPQRMRPVQAPLHPQWGMSSPFILLNQPNAPQLPVGLSLPTKKSSQPPIDVLKKQLASKKEKKKESE